MNQKERLAQKIVRWAKRVAKIAEVQIFIGLATISTVLSLLLSTYIFINEEFDRITPPDIELTTFNPIFRCAYRIPYFDDNQQNPKLYKHCYREGIALKTMLSISNKDSIPRTINSISAIAVFQNDSGIQKASIPLSSANHHYYQRISGIDRSVLNSFSSPTILPDHYMRDTLLFMEASSSHESPNYKPPTTNFFTLKELVEAPPPEKVTKGYFQLFLLLGEKTSNEKNGLIYECPFNVDKKHLTEAHLSEEQSKRLNILSALSATNWLTLEQWRNKTAALSLTPEEHHKEVLKPFEKIQEQNRLEFISLSTRQAENSSIKIFLTSPCKQI